MLFDLHGEFKWNSMHLRLNLFFTCKTLNQKALEWTLSKELIHLQDQKKSQMLVKLQNDIFLFFLFFISFSKVN